jgi:uncharacterized membrane protein YdbT with pleckstrin-like domain
MSYVDDNLLTDEAVIYRGRLHWIVFAAPALLTVVGVILIAASAGKTEVAAITGCGSFLFLAALLLAVGRALAIRSSEFAVTSRRVLIKVGFIRRHSLELLLEKVEGIGVDQGIGGRILGYGTITVTGTGGTKESFKNITNPMEFRRQVQSRVGGSSGPRA